MATPRFVFDYLSPYSYLAHRRLASFPRLARVEPTPVVLGSILSHRGVQGPGEEDRRRWAGLVDILLLAAQYGCPMVGPAKHPFNSVPAMRCTLAAPPDLRPAVSARFFDAAWGEGEDLEDHAVLRRLLAEAGAPRVDPEVAVYDKEIRAELKRTTKAFIEAGGFGVPTIWTDAHLFFGHDRLELANAFLDGQVRLDRDTLERMWSRPRPPRLT